MADRDVGCDPIVRGRTCSRATATCGATRPDVRAHPLRAMPFHRSGQRQPAHDRAGIPHVASQIPDRKPATAVVRGDHCRSSHHAAVSARSRPDRRRHRLFEDARALKAKNRHDFERQIGSGAMEALACKHRVFPFGVWRPNLLSVERRANRRRGRRAIVVSAGDGIPVEGG
jgi:hypothetical protein